MAPFVAPVSASSGPKEDHPDTNSHSIQVGFALPADRQHPDMLETEYVTGSKTATESRISA
jgi:hypothetical protein